MSTSRHAAQRVQCPGQVGTRVNEVSPVAACSDLVYCLRVSKTNAINTTRTRQLFAQPCKPCRISATDIQDIHISVSLELFYISSGSIVSNISWQIVDIKHISQSSESSPSHSHIS